MLLRLHECYALFYRNLMCFTIFIAYVFLKILIQENVNTQ